MHLTVLHPIPKKAILRNVYEQKSVFKLLAIYDLVLNETLEGSPKMQGEILWPGLYRRADE